MKIGIFILLFSVYLQQLSAQNCADSSYRIRYSGTDDYAIRDHITTSDNGSVMVGTVFDNRDTLAKGILIRIDNSGGLVWSKKISNGINSIYLNKVIQLSDGSYIVAGYIYLTDISKQKIFLAKLDVAGNLLWNNLYEHTAHFNPVDQLAFFSLAEGNNGDILTAWNGVHGGDNYDSSYAVISRLNSSGIQVWSKAFVSTDDVSTHPSGIYIDNNDIIIVGQVWDQAITCAPPPSGLVPGLYFGMRISEATGTLELLKSYCYNEIISDQSWGLSASILNRFFSSTKIGSNQYALFGIPVGITAANYFYYYVVFDNQMNLIRSKRYKTPRISGTYPQAFLKSNGDININLVGTRSYWATLDSTDHIKRQKKMSFNATSGFSSYTSYAFKYPSITTLATNYNIGGTRFSEFIQLQDNDESISTCLGTDTSFVVTMPFGVTPVNWAWKYIIDNPVISSPGTFTVTDASMIKESICQQTSRCDTLKIIGADTVCVKGQEEQYTVFKNPECRKHITWQFDSSLVSSATQINDSTLHLRFLAPAMQPAQTTLYASITGNCGTLKDSLKISLLPSLKPIGNDTVICPGQQVKLTPGNWFRQYLWQDGSTDSIFNATQAGVYHVRVQTYCGYYMEDSIRITNPIVLSDHLVSKCNSDSVTIKAIPGLNNYVWTPDYKASLLSDSVLLAFPDTSTYYTATAVTPGGCLMKDSVLVMVNHSLNIRLGNDTSFCEGSSILLDGGSGFIAYQWSNGNISQTISANHPDIYSIMATDNNGCISKDTLEVLSLFPRPVIFLHDQSILCKNKNDTLHIPIGFNSYLWQDGTTSNFYPVTAPGIYWVQVTNSFQCKTSDTVTIVQLYDPPANFIDPDTAICKGGSIVLFPNKTFPEYLWSTGATSASITIKDKGSYSLLVIDQHGCEEEENIVVREKDCQNKLFFPSAFTPNNDGKNDLFKPVTDGVLSSYELTIYNRWGQVIFKSTDYNRGWNGMFNGTMQNNSVLVWICKYQFYNQHPEMQKGTFTLIR